MKPKAHLIFSLFQRASKDCQERKHNEEEDDELKLALEMSLRNAPVSYDPPHLSEDKSKENT